MKVKYIGITNGFLTNGKEYEVRGISVSGDVGVGCAFPASEFLLVKEQKHNFKVGDVVELKNKYKLNDILRTDKNTIYKIDDEGFLYFGKDKIIGYRQNLFKLCKATQ